MKPERREFLKKLSFLGLTAYGLSPPSLAGQGNDNHLIAISGSDIVVVDLENHEVNTYPVGCTAHDFVQNPLNPRRVWLSEKWGAHAKEVDFQTGEITRTLISPPNTQFFGHGLFSKNGDLLYFTRGNFKSGLGHIVGYDTRNFEQVVDFPVAVGGVHDLHFTSKGTILVTSTGLTLVQGSNPAAGPQAELSSLVEADLATGEVIRKIFIKDESQLIGHFAMSDELVFATSANAPRKNGPGGEIYFAPLDSKVFLKAEIPGEQRKFLAGDFSSLAVDPATKRISITNRRSGYITILNSETGAYVATHVCPEYASVSFDKTRSRFVYAGDSIDTLDPAGGSIERFKLGSAVGKMDGSHSLII